MKTVSRICLFGALTLILLTAACAGQEGSPTAVGTIPGNEFTPTPAVAETQTTETAETGTATLEGTLDMTATGDVTATMDLSATVPAGTDTTQTATTDTSKTPGIPVTGEDILLLECQFCIEGMAQALLVLPETATFETVADTASLSTPGPDTGCNAVDTFSGKQIVICRGEENTSLNLNICMDGNNCTQLVIKLQTCPDTGQPKVTDTPGTGAPTDTPTPAVTTETPVATDTPGAPSSPTSTP